MKCVDPTNGCIGCTVCKVICPVKAISFITDSRGFYVPYVDDKKCITCGKCVANCVIQNTRKMRDNDNVKSAYLYARNENERMKSTSGGVFYAIAKEIVREKGVVCGCVWNDSNKAIHVCTQDINVVQKMRGSKYVQSDLGNCFEEIKRYLQQGITVLFSGTGCQATALKNYIGQKGCEHLLCCAVVCEGVPSPKVLDLYLSAIESEYNSKVKSIEMRNKKRGWLMPETEITFECGKKIRQVFAHENLYGTSFGDGLFINEQCNKCPTKLAYVNADILLSDDWGINKYRLRQSKNKGSSAVLILTEKGQDIFEKIKDQMYIQESRLSDIINSHYVLTNNLVDNPFRDEFFDKLSEKSIIQLLQQNYTRWEKKKNVKHITKYLYKFRLYTPIYNFLWKLRNS